MTENPLSKIFSIILFVAIIMGIVTLYMVQTDGNVQTMLMDETTTFADNCRSTGKISPTEYLDYMGFVSMCGEFTAKITIEQRTSYPIVEVVGGVETYTGLYETDYITVAASDILDAMFSGTTQQDYVLQNGDRIKITVTRTGAGMTAFASIIGLAAKENQIVYNYSGVVYHNGTDS